MLAPPKWPADYGEQFWEAYPRRVAKKAAMKALDNVRKSGEVPFEVLLSAVLTYARAVAGKDVQYVAHPATWLNAGRWDDDPTAIAGAAKRSVADVFAGLGDQASEDHGWLLPEVRRH
jgi:hypothetical protein